MVIIVIASSIVRQERPIDDFYDQQYRAYRPFDCRWRTLSIANNLEQEAISTGCFFEVALKTSQKQQPTISTAIMSRHLIMSPILRWICFFTIVCFVQLCSASNNPNSRIVEGIDKWSTDSVVITSSPQNSHARIPEPFSGTINLSFLEGSCHSILEDRWEYTVCPYQNVTSKRIMAQKTNLLGVWGHWTSKQSEESTSRKYPIMEYTDGQGCNGEDSFLTGEKSLRDDKETHASVTLICSSDDRKIDHIHVLSVSESDCHYQFELGLPISCGLLSM